MANKEPGFNFSVNFIILAVLLSLIIRPGPFSKPARAETGEAKKSWYYFEFGIDDVCDSSSQTQTPPGIEKYGVEVCEKSFGPENAWFLKSDYLKMKKCKNTKLSPAEFMKKLDRHSTHYHIVDEARDNNKDLISIHLYAKEPISGPPLDSYHIWYYAKSDECGADLDGFVAEVRKYVGQLGGGK